MSEKISDLLEIILVTYNRDKDLDKTLEQIFAEDSPIRNFEIRIIDNLSTDSTEEVIKKYNKKFPNLIYEKNKRNIGGNANIAKAFYSAKKKYVWILADNDFYCWDSWKEVEQAIEDDKDGIVISTYHLPNKNIAQLFVQATFLPGVIYKTSNIDNEVMVNIEYNISNMFPHIALFSKLINEKLNIFITSTPIVKLGNNFIKGEKLYTRGLKSEQTHPYMLDLSWNAGYANSIKLLKDKKLRSYIASHNSTLSFPLTSAMIFSQNARKHNGSLYNLCCIFCALNFFQKIKFFINLLAYWTILRLIHIYFLPSISNDSDKNCIKVRMRLFSLIDFKLFSFKIK